MISHEEFIESEIEFGEFQIKCLNARESNRAICLGYKIQFEGYMTPSEELFAKFFSEGKTLVKDMDDLSLRAFREEIAEVASKARAYLYGIDDEEKERRKVNRKESGVTGFAPDINDSARESAANAINARKKKMSKQEKLAEMLMKIPGMDADWARKVMSARNIKDSLENADKTDGFKVEELKSSPIVEDTNKKIFNPFEKKE